MDSDSFDFNPWPQDNYTQALRWANRNTKVNNIEKGDGTDQGFNIWGIAFLILIVVVFVCYYIYVRFIKQDKNTPKQKTLEQVLNEALATAQ